MKLELDIPLKKESVIYTIISCNVEKYYVKGFRFSESIKITDDNRDISDYIIVDLDMYNDGENTFKTTLPLSKCFLTKEDLIKSL